MADIAWSNVVAFAPELSTVSAGAQTSLLAYVNDALEVADFGGETGPMLTLARVYLAAHFGAVSLRGASGAAGAVTAESGGGLSIAYASGALALDSSGLGSTPYGQAYLALVRMSPARSAIVI